MSMKSILAAAGLTLAIACGGGGSSNGSATFTGSVRGHAFSPKEALSANATIPTGAGNANVGAIILTTASNTCSNAAANKETKNQSYFVIALGQIKASGNTVTIEAPTATGDFLVYGGSGLPPGDKIAIVVSESTGGDCKQNVGLEAVGTAGTVKVTAINNGQYEGTFTIDLYPGDGSGNANTSGTKETVSGSFKASKCDSLGALVTNQRSTTCI